MSQYDNNMQVIVSKVVSDKRNAPTLRVSVEIDGQRYQAGLWPWTRKADNSHVTDKNGNTQYKGKLEVDDYQGGNGPSAPPDAPPPSNDFDDDIPF